MSGPPADVSVHHGDALDVLAGMDAATVDAVVTDPPYGLEFMGREWDAPWEVRGIGGNTAGLGKIEMADGVERLPRPSFYGSPNPTCRNCGGSQRGREGRAVRKCVCDSPDFPNTIVPRMQAYQQWCEQWAAECLRVLKPGGWLVAFGGTRTHHRLACAVEDAGFEIRDSIAWLYASGFPKSLNLGDGRGTALKPAHEPIVVARKPLAGTVAGNVLEHGTGALNIDGCRVGVPEDKRAAGTKTYQRFDPGSTGKEVQPAPHDGMGRWPPNVALDEAAAAELDRQSGTSVSRVGQPRGADHGDGWGMTATGSEYDDAGGASRFFPVFRYEPKAPAHERPRVNGTAHPTVKPLDLVRWLVRLVTPPGGLVLDPFAGSGTTGEACLIEGFRAVLIEREADYLPLIEARLAKPIQLVIGEIA